jgi:AhpD family alkylhydroperoxidase
MEEYKKMENMKSVLNEVNTSLEHLTKNYPDLMKAFGGFMSTVEKPGALDKKTKELMAISLSIVTHCKWCIAFHVKGALDAGATKDEVMESCFVATLMGGGPALMYTQLAVKALEDLS